MKDLRRALQRRSERGDPIGSDRLRQRVAFELAGGHMRPEDTRRRIPGLAMAAAAAIVVLLGIGGFVLLSGEEEPDVVATTPTTTPTTPTTAIEPAPSISWREADFPTGALIRSIVEGGPGLVAVGCELETIEAETPAFRENAAIWISGDGLTWTQQLDDELRVGAGCISDVVAASVGFVGVATGPESGSMGSFEYSVSSGVLWLSEDGIDWELIEPETMQERVALHIEEGEDGTLVAAGWFGLDALVWTSQDGRAWEPVVDDDLAGRSWVHDLESSPNGYLMSGTDRSSEYFDKPVVWYSPSGTEWSRIPATELASQDPLGAVEGIGSIQYTPDEMWMVADFRGRIWASEDGAAWESVYEPDVVGDLIPGLGWAGEGEYLVTAGRVDEEMGIWISMDGGQNWLEDEYFGIPEEMEIAAVFGFGGDLLAIGSKDLLPREADPDMWSTRIWIGTWDD
jgi:hypothetical protein